MATPATAALGALAPVQALRHVPIARHSWVQVRVVFNLAIGSDDELIKRTACNALLQMLATTAKRVT